MIYAAGEGLSQSTRRRRTGEAIAEPSHASAEQVLGDEMCDNREAHLTADRQVSRNIQRALASKED